MLFLFLHLSITLGGFAFFWFRFRNQPELSELSLLQILEKSPKRLREVAYGVFFFSFLSFLLLPLSLGFSVYLHTDANVLVVVVWIVWTYNWCKYTFWRE
ncbi:MAG: hypothetical protein O9301_13240 [Leptospira sp.]|nr:hypothetical protein [Leptospira sp.]